MQAWESNALSYQNRNAKVKTDNQHLCIPQIFWSTRIFQISSRTQRWRKAGQCQLLMHPIWYHAGIPGWFRVPRTPGYQQRGGSKLIAVLVVAAALSPGTSHFFDIDKPWRGNARKPVFQRPAYGWFASVLSNEDVGDNLDYIGQPSGTQFGRFELVSTFITTLTRW